MAERSLCMLPHRVESQRLAARGVYAKHHVDTALPVTPQQHQLNMDRDATRYEHTRAAASRDNSDALSRMCNLNTLYGYPSAQPLFPKSQSPTQGTSSGAETSLNTSVAPN